MKKKLYFLAFLMCFLGALNTMNAQTTVGQKGSKSNNLPSAIYDGVPNTMTQQIYTSTELSSAGISNGDVISSIAFMPATVNKNTANWSVYLVNTNKNNFESRTDYVTISNQANFTGQLSLISENWTTINFTTPFTYTGGNILICVLDYDATPPSNANSYYVYETSEVSLLALQGSNVLDVTKNPTENLNSTMLNYYAKTYYNRNYIQFTKSAGAPITAPSAPTNLTATAEETSILLKWDAVDGATSYKVYQKGNNVAIATTLYPTHLISGLSTDVDYCYTVSAVNGEGEESARSEEVCVTIQSDSDPSTGDIDPSKQYRIKVASGTGEGQYLTIFNNNSHASGSVGGVGTYAATETYEQIFTLEKANDGGYYLLSQNGYYIYCQKWNVDALSNQKSSLSGFVIGSEFQISNNNNLNDESSKKWFKVQNVSGSNYVFCDATSSNVTWILEEVVVPEPAVPTNLTAHAYTYNTVDLSWTYTENAKSYNVYKNGEFVSNVSGLYFQVTGLDAETNYCFTITAVNGSKESEHSEEACATTPEICNVVFTLKDNYNGSGDGWNGGNLTVSYNNGQSIEYTLDNYGFVQYTLGVLQNSNVSVKYIGSNWPDENALIIAYEDGRELVNVDFGEMTQTMEWNFTVNCSATPEAPIVTAMALSESSIRLRWNEDANATSYKIYDNNDAFVVEVTETSYLFEGLDANTEYCYTVKAVNGFGESDASNEACATTFEDTDGCIVTFNLTDLTDDWNGCKLVVEYENISRELTLVNAQEETFTMEIPQGTNVTAKFVAAVGSEGNGYPQECGFTIAYESGKEILVVNGMTYSQYNTTTVTYNFTIDCSSSTDVIIGEGSETSMIPIEILRPYSYSQQSYTRDEITDAGGFEGYITTIAYNVNFISENSGFTRNLKIFMSNAEEEVTFTNNSNVYSLSNDTDGLVFDGEVTFATTGWVEIPLMAPFLYNGNHIVITVIDNTGIDGGVIYFTTHTKYEYESEFTTWTSNGNNSDSEIIPTTLDGQTNSSRNNIKLSFIPIDATLEFIGSGSWDITTNWNLRKTPTESDYAIILGDAVITGEATAKSLKVDNGSITIESGSLSVVEGIENNDVNKLVLHDGAQLFQNNADLQGTFVMNINNPSEWSSNNKTGWQFIASPFTNAAVSQFTNTGDNYDLYKFDGRHENITKEWRNHKDATANFETEFVSGRGYMASYQNNTTATLSGTFNNATSISYPVTYQDIEDNKPHWPNFHLLGNPFTFDMDVEKLSMTNMATGVAMVNNGGTYDYMTTGTIKVGDGFFVKSMAANPVVSYSNAPTRGGNDDNTSDNISVRVSSSATRDNVVLNFAGSDKAGFPKLNAFNEDAAYLYVVSEEQRYGIFNYDKDVNEVSLSFEAQKMGKYTISVDAEGEYETIVLVDRQTGIETNMLLEDYSFTATSSSKENTDRFLVRFTFRSDVNEEAKHFAYQSGDELIIEAEGTVQLFDVTGRMLYIGEVESHGERINVGHLNNAAYILRLVNEEGVKVQKVIIY